MAFEKGKKDLKILVYKTGVSNIRTLYKVIDVAKNVTLD